MVLEVDGIVGATVVVEEDVLLKSGIGIIDLVLLWCNGINVCCLLSVFI